MAGYRSEDIHVQLNGYQALAYLLSYALRYTLFEFIGFAFVVRLGDALHVYGIYHVLLEEVLLEPENVVFRQFGHFSLDYAPEPLTA